jgi:hypothetical protein
MELKSSSPYPQVPAICLYPEPTPSSPHDPLQLPEDPYIYYSLELASVSNRISKDKRTLLHVSHGEDPCFICVWYV